MSDFSTFLDDIRNWTGRADYSDAIVTSFVRMVETQIKDALRVREMIVRSNAVITGDGEVALPEDWVEAEQIRIADGKPLEFITNDEFWNGSRHRGNYTIIGNDIAFGADIDEVTGLTVSMAYYQHLPQFVDESTWFHTKYYNIFLQSCNAASALFNQEFERAASINEVVGSMIEAANATYRRGKISGSVLRTKPGKRIG